MVKLEESFNKFYNKIEEAIMGQPYEGTEIKLFYNYIKPFLGKTIQLDLIFKDGFSYSNAVTKCKVLKAKEKLDLYGYYFVALDLKVGKETKTIYIGGYPVEPLYNNFRTDYDDTRTLNSLDGAPQEFTAYVDLIKQFNDTVHNNIENGISEDPAVIANALMGEAQAKTRVDIRADKLKTISKADTKLGIEVDETTKKEVAISDSKWAELAEIAKRYYDPANVIDEEGQYQFFREKGAHWAVTDGETVFANAATACKFYAEGMNLDPEKEMKKGNLLYNACENIDSKGRLSTQPVLMYKTPWRYATADEILNSKDRADAAMWHR